MPPVFFIDLYDFFFSFLLLKFSIQCPYNNIILTSSREYYMHDCFLLCWWHIYEYTLYCSTGSVDRLVNFRKSEGENTRVYHLGIAHYYYYCYFTIIVIIILLLLLLLLLWMQWLLSHAVTHRRHYRLLLSRSVLTRLPFNKPRALKLDWL